MLVYTLHDLFSLFICGIAVGSVGVSSFFAWLEVRRWNCWNKRKGIK